MLPDEVEAYMKSPTPTHPACVVIPFRRGGAPMPIQQQSFVRNHGERLRELRRARLLRVAKWTSLWSALAVGLAYAAVYLRAAWMARGMR